MNVIVIGAGPAGSLCAILLARAGVDTTLIEQHRFPRDKVCGECLSALGREVLRRHDLERGLLRAGAIELIRAGLHAPNDSITLDLPQPMLGISRAALDATLLDHARAAGATILQPTRVEHIDVDEISREVRRVGLSPRSGDEPVADSTAREEPWAEAHPTNAHDPTESDAEVEDSINAARRPRVRLRDLPSNNVRTLEADLVVLADGRCALLGAKPQATADLGIKAHYENVDADPHAITLYNTADCYGGAAPIEPRERAGPARWNVAFSVPAARVREAGGDIAAVFGQLIDSNATMRRHFTRATRLGDWLASPLPRHAVRDDWAPGVIPIGNAAAAIEPIGGEGMGLALRSAELAVEAILTDRVDALPDQYRALWRRRSVSCRAGGWIFSRPGFADAAIGLMNLTTIPTGPVLALVGK